MTNAMDANKDAAIAILAHEIYTNIFPDTDNVEHANRHLREIEDWLLKGDLTPLPPLWELVGEYQELLFDLGLNRDLKEE